VALALYRKYRPRTFAEIIGQEHVTEPLSQALRSGRLHHAYLFSGPRGCGKTSSARILARSLNCEKGPTPDPCGECQSCRDLAPDGAGSIDVIEIDAASHGGVDDARDLRERAFFAPVASRFKVYVIDEAHMVSSAGFNALLKLVEEPPEFVKFVFATTEPEKVLGTIKSRTHHYPFRLIPPGVLRPYLEELCEREGVKVEPAIFPLVVRAGGGSARDTLSVLDQLIAGAGPDGVSYTRAVALLGVTDVALIDEMCDALAAGDGAAAYATVDRVSEAGHDPRRFASDLLERLRDLIVLQQVPDAAAKGLLDGPDDQLERMAAQAARVGPATLSRFADIVHNGLTEMRGTTAPRLLLELITARMLLPGADDSPSALLQRLERMERRLGAAGDLPPVAASHGTGAVHSVSAPPAVAAPGERAPAEHARPAPVAQTQRPHASVERPEAPVERPSPAAEVSAPTADPAGSGGAVSAGSPTVAPSSAPPAVMPEAAMPEAAMREAAPVGESETRAPGGLDAAAVRRAWDEILATVRRQSQKAGAVVREATVREVDGNTVILVFRHAVHADMLTRSPEFLIQAMTETFGGTWQVRCEVGGGPAGGARSQGAQRSAPTPAQAPPAPPTQASPAPPAQAPSAQIPPAPPAQAAPSQRSPRPTPAANAAPDDGDDGWPTPARLGGPGPAGDSPTPAGPSAAAGDWPAPARPGGAVPVADDWPTPARPGGQPGGAPAPGAAAGPSGSVTAPVAAAAPTGGGTPGTMDPAPVTPAAAGPAAWGRTGAAAPGGSGSAGNPAGPAPVGNLAGSAPVAAPAGMVAAPPAPGALGTGRSAAAAAARAAAAGLAGRQATAARPTSPAAAAAGHGNGGPPGRAAGPGANQAGGWGDEEPPYDPDYDKPVRDPQYPGFDPGDEPVEDEGAAVRESSEEQALRLLAEALGAEKIEDGRP
jgi:DNA polymerase-3 subunit gamma/tau